MNLKQSLKGFQKTNWDNKSTKQKQKALVNQYDKLGLKVPKYVQGKTLSDKNLNKALNRINKVYERRIEKSLPKVKLSDLQYEINKHNTIVGKKIKQLEKLGYSEKTIDFLKGNRIYLEITDRAIQKQGALLKKLDLDNYHANQEGMRSFLSQIKEKTKKLNKLDLINSEENRVKNTTLLEDILLNNNIFADNTDSEIEYLVKSFSEHNNVQQEVALNSIISEFREKYKGEEIDGELMTNALAKLSRNLKYVKENV